MDSVSKIDMCKSTEMRVNVTKKEFRDLCEKGFLVLDGATGSNLMKRGMPIGACPEKWVLEHPDVLVELQREYVEAGSNILYTPTFTANTLKLKEYGLEQDVRRINRELAALSRKAAGNTVYVAGDLTMTGVQLKPMGSLDFEELVEIYKVQIEALVEGGVDLLVVETMMSLQETRAALIAAKECCELPVICTLTFENNGRTLYGTDAESAAITLESLGASAIGANCSTGPAQLAKIIERMAKVTSIPLVAKPNAGLPSLDENKNTVYLMTPEEFGTESEKLLLAGATIVGGCCGTNPKFIEAISAKLKDADFSKYHENRKSLTEIGKRRLCSERMSFSFGMDEPFFVVGERINPTGKKKLQEELRQGSFELVKQYAEEQEQNGAKVLDVNVGMGGIDEKATLLEAMEQISMVTNLPLSIDSSSIEAVESALRRYPGRALINSISLEKEKFEKLLPIAGKYGAMFILLPLSDKGLPENAEEKISIIETICRRAYELGFQKEDIVVDGLVTTVGANKNAAKETLQTIRYCKENGLATTCGLSNISFGLPERTYVNTAFLTMAIQSGLTMAIANPSQEMLVCAKFASDLLLNKEEADILYIEYMNEKKERDAIKASQARETAVIEVKKEAVALKASEEKPVSVDAELENDVIYKAVLKGNKKAIVELTSQEMEAGRDPREILDKSLMPAINKVGELFDKGKYFLPQLIASAEAMKCSIEHMEPYMMEDSGKEKLATVVIATVEGDIHDIGKNLVVMMLKNHGYNVIDLGKDVPAKQIIEAAIEHKAKVIGLSALMTTTMQQMAKVINEVRQQQLDIKCIVGGAVITEDFAHEIGADGYSKDAAEAVRVVKRLTEE